MKKLIELGNRYARESSWTDYALVKFCLCAMGVIIGTCIPKKDRKTAIAASGTVFLITYLPLMKRVLNIAKKMQKEERK